MVVCRRLIRQPGGWIGFANMAGGGSSRSDRNYSRLQIMNGQQTGIRLILSTAAVVARGSVTSQSRFLPGEKGLLLDHYAGLAFQFCLAIDFGWFYS